MANITGRITINETDFIEVDADPGAGAGTVANVGDIAVDTLTGLIYTKRSSGDTDWKLLTHDNYTDSVSASGNITTTSTSDVLATGMTLTPPSGTYMVFFQTSLSHGSNGGSAYANIYAGGSLVANSEIQFKRSSQNMIVPSSINGILTTVNGSQAIEARWRVNSGTGTMNIYRYLSVLRVA